MASEAAFEPIFERDDPQQGPTRGPVFGDFFHVTSGRRLLVMVEPIATTARARENATKILEVAGSRFRSQPLMALRDIVVDCCDNAIHAGDRPTWPKLRTVGVTAAIIDGQHAVVARTAPGAVFLIQDGKLVTDPPIHLPSYARAAEDERSLLDINFQPGDLLMIASSAFCESLRKAATSVDDGFNGLAESLTRPVNDILTGFEELAQAHELDARAGTLLFGQSYERAVIWQPAGIGPDDESRSTRIAMSATVSHKIVSIYGDGPRPRAHPPASTPVEHAPASSLLVESKYERFHTYLLEAFESHVPKHKPVALAFAGGAAVSGVPGANTVQLFRGHHGDAVMTGVRTYLPRGPRVRVPAKLISAVLALLVLLASVGFMYDRREGRAEALKQAITAADVQLASAANESNPVTLAAELALAEKALATAEANGASDSQLVPRRRALAAVKDRIANIVRLTDITRVGMVPPDLSVLNPKLVQHGRDVYLVGGGLYHLDPESKALNLVLRQDKKIAGGKVGKLISGSVDGNELTLTDGAAIYRQGTTGKWKRLVIGTIEDEPWAEATNCGTYGGNFYFLNASGGQILKFDSTNLANMPEAWSEQTMAAELEQAVDMVVDSNITVLLNDGRLHTFFQGTVDSSFSVDVSPAVANPTVLYGGRDLNFLYIADQGSGSGRIVRLERSGALSKQILLPEKGQEGYTPGAEHAFAHIDDLIVDEVTGHVVILSGDQIWTAIIPSVGTLTA